MWNSGHGFIIRIRPLYFHEFLKPLEFTSNKNNKNHPEKLSLTVPWVIWGKTERMQASFSGFLLQERVPSRAHWESSGLLLKHTYSCLEFVLFYLQKHFSCTQKCSRSITNVARTLTFQYSYYLLSRWRNRSSGAWSDLLRRNDDTIIAAAAPLTIDPHSLQVMCYVYSICNHILPFCPDFFPQTYCEMMLSEIHSC